MQIIDIAELTPKIQELLNQMQHGEEVIITAENKPVAKIVQLAELCKRRRAGTAKGSFWMSPDFNQPLDDFKESMP